MSMPITNTTQFAAPPVPADIAQAAPALAGTDVAAAFADWMGMGTEASAAPVEAAPNGEAPPQPGGDTAGSEQQAATAEQPQVQAEQQELSSLQAMMLTMPVALTMPAQAPVQFMQALPAATADGAAPQDASAPAPVAAVTGSVAFAAPVAQPAAAAPAVQPQQPAVNAQPAPSFAAPASQAPVPAAAPAAEAPAAFEAPVTATGTGAAAPATATVAAATELKLAAAKPADWQQPLREALGERLQLQLSKNIDQAVIRLDPPNLGRVEIAIRHIAGSLEVNISATHTEVVRQLHTISDTMRTDLAQRHLSQFSQFTEVAVNITAAPRAAAGQQQAFDQQGRQRQQDQAADDNGPGRGLAEAGNPSSTFSLNARESYA